MQKVYSTESLLTGVDQDMFAPGQAYVAMSRAPSWDSLDILNFDFSCIKANDSVIREYARLNSVNREGLNVMK